MIAQHIIDQVLEHAGEVAPMECCGIISGGEYRRCRNIAPFDSDKPHFALDPRDYLLWEGKIEAIAHSHVKSSPNPSEPDLVGCERSGVPWLIVSHPSGAYREIAPCGYRAPLLGRVFSHGAQDCYGMFRDIYAERLGIDLMDFYRPDDWWNKGLNLFVDNYEKAGFVRTQEPRPYDMLLMQLRAPVPNHCAFYEGNEIILHHVMNRLSTREVYGGFWGKVTTHVLRHKSLL